MILQIHSFVSVLSPFVLLGNQLLTLARCTWEVVLISGQKVRQLAIVLRRITGHSAQTTESIAYSEATAFRKAVIQQSQQCSFYLTDHVTSQENDGFTSKVPTRSLRKERHL